MVSLALSTSRTIATARLNRKEGSSGTDVFLGAKKETLVTENGPRSIMSQLSAARLLETAMEME